MPIGSRTARHAVVTGASGYLGRHLASALEARGWHVTRCLRDAKSVPNAVSVPDLTAAAFEAIPWPVDTVFHLAGLAHRFPPNVPSDAEFERVNAGGCREVACAARNRARRVVLASSIAAMGGDGRTVLSRESVCTPRTAYGRSKLNGERALRDALAGSTTDAVVLRFPAIYGPDAPGAVSQLARWVTSGRPLPSCARDARRSMISVANAVDACIAAAESAEISGKTALPADRELLSVLDAARAIARGAHRGSRTLPCPAFVLRALARIGEGFGIATFSSAERMLESTVTRDDTLERLAGWRPSESAHAALAALGAAAARNISHRRNVHDLPVHATKSTNSTGANSSTSATHTSQQSQASERAT